jgi:hypothetical protein
MQEKFTYDLAENHVNHRRGISPAMRSVLFELPRNSWTENPRFQGEPRFWLEIHQGLLGASSALAGWTEAFCEKMEEQEPHDLARRISSLGAQLVRHAHTHHHIEDHHFFPVFLRMFPQLQHPLEMLDGDHKVLGEVLDDLENAVAGFPVKPEGADKAVRDAWLAGAERLLPAARRLDALFIRHINDEEEICVPALLKA